MKFLCVIGLCLDRFYSRHRIKYITFDRIFDFEEAFKVSNLNCRICRIVSQPLICQKNIFKSIIKRSNIDHSFKNLSPGSDNYPLWSHTGLIFQILCVPVAAKGLRRKEKNNVSLSV